MGERPGRERAASGVGRGGGFQGRRDPVRVGEKEDCSLSRVGAGGFCKSQKVTGVLLERTSLQSHLRAPVPGVLGWLGLGWAEAGPG